MIRTYFDIMADTAGYSVVERSIVRFEYRSDDNNLYNRSCTEVLISCEDISTTLWKIPLYLKDTIGSKW